jgi:hypothetical protein
LSVDIVPHELQEEMGSEAPLGDAEAKPDRSTVGDGNCLLGALRAGGAYLDRHVGQVNALNVFPVPDGDTGTNMSLTMRAAVGEVGDKAHSSASEVARIVAHGALMGARGNSGVILSQIMRGFARALDAKETFMALDLAEALKEGATTAYKGVMKPVEGTILTVAREAAGAAGHAAAQGATIEGVLASAVTEAWASLARTPQLLPVLAEAGVVDAGGQGFTVLLEGMLRYVRGEGLGEAAGAGAQRPEAHVPEGQYNYDTQFVILGKALDVAAIREQVAKMGDSVMVVGDENTVKVHVHSDSPGRVIEYGSTQGKLSSVVVENMQLQYESFQAAQALSASRIPAAMVSSSPAGQLSEIATVAVVSGEGLRRVFESLGVSAIVSGGQTMNPSTQDLLMAIASVPSDQVILLPNNSNVILTAQQAKDLSAKHAALVPTRTVPQGIAALLAFNYQADLEANVEFMSEAGSQVQTGEITRAVRSVQVNGLAVAAGQIIGLLNGELVTADTDIPSVIRELLQRMRAEEREIITVYYGQDLSLADAEKVAEEIGRSYPGVDLEVLDGGQPYYYYIISAE